MDIGAMERGLANIYDYRYDTHEERAICPGMRCLLDIMARYICLVHDPPYSSKETHISFMAILLSAWVFQLCVSVSTASVHGVESVPLGP
jgi:hypothetical protein